MLDIAPENIERKGRLQPGRMFLVDTEQGRIVEDEEIKRRARRAQAVRQVAARQQDRACRARGRRRRAASDRAGCTTSLRTAADVRLHAGGPAHPDVADGRDGRGAGRLDGQRHAARGASATSRSCSVQLLQAALRAGHEPADRPDPRGARDDAQTYIGPEGNLLDETARAVHRCSSCRTPSSPTSDLAKLRHANIMHHAQPPTLPMLFTVSDGGAGLKEALDELCRRASDAVDERARLHHPERPRRRRGRRARSRRCWRRRRCTII